MALVGAFRASRALRNKLAAPASAMSKIDWKELDRCIQGWSWDPEVKGELLKFKHELTETVKRVESMFVTEEPKLDWDAHRKVLPDFVVDLYKKTYEDMEFPPIQLPERAEYEKKFAELEKEAIAADEEIAAMRIEVEKELAKIREFKARLPTITVDEVLAERPDLKEKIDAEIRDNNWDYVPLGSSSK